MGSSEEPKHLGRQAGRASFPVNPAYPAEDDFHLRLYRAFHAQRTFLRAGHAQTGLGYGQPKLLAYIARHEACTQRDLARYYDLDAAGVCRMLNALEHKGLISSAPDPADRRAKHLRITPDGERLLTIWQNHCDQLEEELLAGFSPTERAQFARYLELAYLNLKGKAPHVIDDAATRRDEHAGGVATVPSTAFPLADGTVADKKGPKNVRNCTVGANVRGDGTVADKSAPHGVRNCPVGAKGDVTHA